jgi:hypothetical protein
MERDMPSNVVWYERLMYGSLLLGLVNVLSVLRREPSLTSDQLIVVIGIVVVIMVVFGVVFVWLVARRRHGWPRYVFAVLAVLGVPATVKMVGTDLSAQPLEAGLSAAQLVMQVVALFLIFTGNAREWFVRAPAAAPVYAGPYVPPAGGADWFYALNNQSIGPVAPQVLRSLLAAGTISGDTLVWTGAFGSTWKPLRDTELMAGR